MNNPQEEIHLASLKPELISADSTIIKILLNHYQKNQNIAITGPYGSGKSSIILTFLQTLDEEKIRNLNISLGTINEVDNATNKSESLIQNWQNQCNIFIDEIEKSILQQIFYSCKSGELPKSNFNRLNETDNSHYQALALTSIFTLVAILFNFQSFATITLFNISCTYWDIPFGLSTLSLTSAYYNIIFIIPIFILLFIMYLIIKFTLENFHLDLNLKKIKIFSCELDLLHSKSLLNQYLEEILYFFEQTKTKVVVFEDLDRFETPEIFIKLRELNYLINNNKNADEKVTFIYAVKDDLFTKPEERTKFFDLIIPVVPIVNSNNAKALFKQELGNDVFAVKDEVIETLSFYFSDARLIKNTVNEFKITILSLEKAKTKEEKNTDEKLPIDKSRLFAYLCYKNLFPASYAKQALNGKFIDSILKKAKEVKSTLIDAIKNHNYYKEYNNEQNLLPLILEINNLSLSNLLNHCEKHLKEIKNEKNRGYGNFSFSVKDTINSPIDEVIKSEDSSDNFLQFIKDLMNLDIIDNDYFDYFGYFYEEDLTIADEKFLRHLKNNWNLPPDHQLKRLESVEKKIKKNAYFQKNAILNFDLLNYFYNAEFMENSPSAKKIIEKIYSSAEKTSIDFVNKFLDQTSYKNEFQRDLLAKFSEDERLLSMNIDQKEIIRAINAFLNKETTLKESYIKALINFLSQAGDEILQLFEKKQLSKIINWIENPDDKQNQEKEKLRKIIVKLATLEVNQEEKIKFVNQFVSFFDDSFLLDLIQKEKMKENYKNKNENRIKVSKESHDKLSNIITELENREKLTKEKNSQSYSLVFKTQNHKV